MSEFLHSTEFQDEYFAVPNWASTLSASITDSDVVATLISVTSLPDKGWIHIEDEIIFYSGIETGSIQLVGMERGIGGTSAASHSAGVTVEQKISAQGWNQLMSAVKKRKNYTLTTTQVSAGTISEQSLTGFASRARFSELVILATGGSTDFVIEFYRTDAFRGIDKIYETTSLNSIETTLDASTSGTEIPVTSTTGFFINEVAQLSGIEMFMIDDINAGVSLESADTITGSYNSGDTVVQGYRDLSGFYYEDTDWSAELHIKILNNDTSNPVTVKMEIVAEVSDE